MGANWGKNIRLSIFGESHGPAIGMVLDEEAIAREMERRAPGRNKMSTQRREGDKVRILSGFYQGKTTGGPLCGVIENTNQRSGAYGALEQLPRPGHADYAGAVRFSGCNDPRGGGHFSGRLTAPLVFAGAIAKQWLSGQGVETGGHVLSAGGLWDDAFDPCATGKETLAKLREMELPVLRAEAGKDMRESIEKARLEGDSVGGRVELIALGLPVGWGSPFFDSVESVASSLFFSVPAVKGVEFGAGFGFCDLRGSQANDPFRMADGRVVTATNHNGGINGGITNGMPVMARVAVKPTPSIAKEQDTVNLLTRQNAALSITGRHDPCIVQRALPVLESALALALMECAPQVRKYG